MPRHLTPDQSEAVRRAVPVVRELDWAVADLMAIHWRQEYGGDIPPAVLAEYVRTGKLKRQDLATAS